MNKIELAFAAGCAALTALVVSWNLEGPTELERPVSRQVSLPHDLAGVDLPPPVKVADEVARTRSELPTHAHKERLEQLAEIRPDVKRAMTVIYPDDVTTGVPLERVSPVVVSHDMNPTVADHRLPLPMKVDPRREGQKN